MIAAGSLSRSVTGGGRTALSRVTLVGERRRVDLVLPSREPIGVLLPELMRVLDDRVGERPRSRYLVAPDGSALAPDGTLESAGVTDGAVLRLVRVEEAPSAPVVHDVSDEAADDLAVRGWRWQPATRRVVAAGATVFWAVAAGLLARGHFGLSTVAGAVTVVAVAVALAGVLFGRLGKAGLAATTLLTSGALGVLGAWTAADAHDWSAAARLAAVSGAVAVPLLLASWCTPLGRAAVIGAGSIAGCLLLWEVVIAVQGGAVTGVQQTRVGARPGAVTGSTMCCVS